MKNIFNSAISFLKHLRYGTRLDPVRDWLVLLVLGAIILSGVIVWNVWAFGTVANGGVIGTSATSTPPAFNQSSLNAVQAIFQNRAAEEAKYRTGTYRFADPSK